MKLSKTSWHYKLNRWYTWKVPNNLCGYFWRTVWYTIAFIPTLIIFIPIWIYLLFSKKKWDEAVYHYPMALGLNLVLGLITCMVLVWFHTLRGEHDPWQVVFIFGIVGYLAATTGLLAFFADKMAKRRRTKGTSNRPNLVKEYLKAKKNKYCPIIEWED